MSVTAGERRIVSVLVADGSTSRSVEDGVESPDVAQPPRYDVVENPLQLGANGPVHHPPGHDGIGAYRRPFVGGSMYTQPSSSVSGSSSTA